MYDLLTLDYAEGELRYNAFNEPALRVAIASLALPRGSHGLDAGCGPGGVFHLLAETIGAGGRINGIDGSEPHLRMAAQQVAERRLEGRVDLRCARLDAPLAIADNTFDWVWSADVLCHGYFRRPEAVVKELIRVTRPGGTIALFFGSFYRSLFLPGYSRLERLIATAAEERAPASGYADREPYHQERMPLWLHQVGAEEIGVSVHAFACSQPLDEHVREYIQESMFEVTYKRGLLQSRPGESDELSDAARAVGLTEADLGLFQRITDPRSPEYLLDRPDYYCIRYATLVTGRKP